MADVHVALWVRLMPNGKEKAVAEFFAVV